MYIINILRKIKVVMDVTLYYLKNKNLNKTALEKKE